MNTFNYPLTLMRQTATPSRGLITSTVSRCSTFQQCRDLARLDRQKLREANVDPAASEHLVWSVALRRFIEIIDRHGTSHRVDEKLADWLASPTYAGGQAS